MHKISIIIPVYNVSHYIGRCLESVFSQECPEVDIECILIDDCSPDDSMEVATRMIDDYNSRGGKIQFKTSRLPKNSGHCAARNAAVRIASGDYYLFVDSDDYLERDSVKFFVEELDSFDELPDVVMANAFSTYEKKLLSVIPEKQYIDNTNYDGLKLLLNRLLFNTSWNKLVKASFFTEKELYFPEGVINEDLLWSYLLFLRARTILLLPQVTYFYETGNLQSITNTNTTAKLMKFIKSRIYICNQIFHYPPRIIIPEYYGYLYCILHRTINVLESHINSQADVFNDRQAAYQLRSRLLHSSWNSGYPLLCCLIFTLYKPFYYIVRFKVFRSHFNYLIRAVVAASRKLHF